MNDSHKKRGDHGEVIAQNYLKKHKYKISFQNFRSRYGEIDIIAQKSQRLYFVEVKRRTNQAFGKAIFAIPLKKQKRIRKTAEFFFLTYPQYEKYIPYFSALLIDETSQSREIEFIEDAFGL